MFPVLSDADITRMRRFGTPQDFKRGDTVCAAGGPSHGMFVVREGALAISQRDALGHVVPIVRQGAGQFKAEVGTLSGRPALVDVHAVADTRTLLVRPGQLRALIMAEADLGERLVRALILRRVGLIEAGHSGPVLIGQPQSPAVLHLRNFLARNGQPHHVVDVHDDVDAAALMEQYGAAVSEVLVVCPDGSVLLDPSVQTLARCIGMVDRRRRRGGAPRLRMGDRRDNADAQAEQQAGQGSLQHREPPFKDKGNAAACVEGAVWSSNAGTTCG
jgi:thioredoxin reductase (NADPH)